MAEQPLDQKENDYLWPNCAKKIWPLNDDIVISGIAGRFPQSDNIDELAANLLNKIDMVTQDDSRWPIGLNNDPASRSGKIKNLEHFDNAYFSTIPMLADVMEPGSRIILETTYEAIADAGISPQDIRGTNTGVYVGINTVANAEAIPQDDFSDIRVKDAAFWVYGSSRALLANRISFLFDFNGPSTVIDTACSASMVALANAVGDLRAGNCEMAIVATSNICLAPYSSYVYHSLGLLSADGKCKVFDKNADGFVRSETVGSLFLMRKSMAKRIYATILHAKTNTDGFKTIGLFAPFWLRQRNLMIETFQEVGLNPEDIDYFESHGTGTNVGDPQESKAVSQAYCQNRKKKLLVGAVKSNLGHTEGASGLCSIAKAIIIFENKIIPANLHFNEAKPEIECLHKTIEPVVENTPFDGKIIGVNSFGVGGVNAHALLKINEKEINCQSANIVDSIPRLVNVCGRTKEAVQFIFDFIKNNPEKIHNDFLALLSDSMKTSFIKGSANFPFRGYLIMDKITNPDQIDQSLFNYSTTIENNTKMDHLWLIFTGMGSQWSGMGKELMKIDQFAQSINNSASILRPYGIDLLSLILDEQNFKQTVNSFVAITSMQIALFDVLMLLNLPISGYIGHSFGEIACAYADGCLTAEQALLTSYWRGKTVEDSSNILPKGLMAAVGLSVSELEKLCPNGVYVACHNGQDSVTISGIYQPMIQFLDTLKMKNIFFRKVTGGEFPYHSEQMSKISEKMLKKLNEIIKEPKRRSAKWITTSVTPNADCFDDSSLFASGIYFTNNLIRPVYFEEGMRLIPKKSCCIEMAPHSLFQSIFKRCYGDYNYISLMQKNETNNLQYFLQSIGKIYTFGFNPCIENLYPKVTWPVIRGTPSISSLIKWDHSREHEIKKYPEYHNFSTSSHYLLKISLLDPDWRFLKDHIIDGRLVFPFTGYLMIVWRAMATKIGQPWHKVAIQFKNVRIYRPTFLNETKPIKFTVQILDLMGEFSLSEGNHLICKGIVNVPDSPKTFIKSFQSYNKGNDSLQLNSKEIYKELHVRGYNYGPMFQGLKVANENGTDGIVEWTGNWISFVDSALHLSLLSIPVRALFIPVQIDLLKCDPIVLFNSIYKEEENNEIYPELTETTITQSQQQLKKEFCYFHDIAKQNEMLHKTEMENMVHNTDSMPFEIMNFSIESKKNETKKAAKKFNVQFDFNNQLLTTVGLEIKGLVPVNVPRKSDDSNLVLERYLFMPFNDEQNFSINYSLDQYIELCLEMLDRLMAILKLSVKNETTKMDKLNSVDKLFKNEETFHYFNILRKLLEIVENENTNSMESARNVSKKFLNDNLSHFELDILNMGILNNEYFTRPIVELFCENVQNLSTVKVLEICPNENLLAKIIIKFIKMNVIYKFELDYIATKHDRTVLPEITELKTIDWNLSDVAFLDSFAEEFDLIILQTNDITNKLWNQKNYFDALITSIKPSGFMLICSQHREPNKFETILDNFLDGNLLKNKFKNQFERTSDCILASGQFHAIASRLDQKTKMKIVLYRKKCFNNEKNIYKMQIDLNLHDYTWIDCLKNQINNLKQNDNPNDRLWIISNSNCSGIIGFGNCIRLEQSYGHKIRVLSILDGDEMNCLADCDEQSSDYKLFEEIFAKDLMFNVLSNKTIGMYRFIKLTDEKFITITDNAYVGQSHLGDLSSVQWFQSEHEFFTKNESELNENAVLCDVYYSAINFKDVVLATGKIVPGPESALLDSMLGLEYSGRRQDTGERIMGMVPFKGISTKILTYKDFVWPIPDQWTLEDAATVPIVYVTAYYALVMRGRLKEYDSVLIHSAAGGVGQAAINICQAYHCEVFVTVGNEEKRQFIRTKYGIDDDHIMNSRNILFEQNIKTITNGRGVDLVLNSLAGEKLQASVQCLAVNGRFLEIGKYDMQMNSTLGMFCFLKNISFHGIGLDSLFREGLNSKTFRSFFVEITDLMNDGIKRNIVRPINRTVFSVDQVKEAFRFMTDGKHIGKVLIRIKNEELVENNREIIKEKPVLIRSTIRTWFNPFKIYLIAGGLGGVGLELIYWMVIRGARKFVITSRNGLKSSYQKAFFRRFKLIEKFCPEYQINFVILTHNIGIEQECRTLIEEILMKGSIGGIFNLTLVLQDSLFINQTVEMFDSVCQPKLNGLMNLDRISREKCLELDHFVAFSSFSAGRGNAGQTNYGYANSAMEQIIENRNSSGLNGMAIQFGPINDVGIVAECLLNESENGENNEERIKLLMGLCMQRINSCMEVLDLLLPQRKGIYSSYVRYSCDSHQSQTDDEVIRQLCAHLNIDKRPEDECLGDIGLDSMAAVEIQQRLERDFSISLSLADVRKITVKELKNFRDGNRHNLKQYSDDIKKARANLSRLRFVIPSIPVVALNKVSEGKPIYCLPSLIGIFDLISVIVQKITRPVYGLNWTQELNTFGTLKQVVNYYYRLIMTKMNCGNSNDTSFDLMGMDFGALLAGLMCKNKNILPRLNIGRIIIVDLLPVNLNQMIDEKKLSDYKVMLIFDYIRLYIPERICEQSQKEVLELSCETARIEKIIELLRKCLNVKQKADDNMPEIIRNTYRRASLMLEYQIKLKRKFAQRRLRGLILKMLERNAGRLKIDYIKFIHRNEPIDSNDIYERKLAAILALNEDDIKRIRNEFANQFQLKLIKCTPDDLFEKLHETVLEGL